MFLESEMYSALKYAFLLVVVVTIISTAILYRRTKSSGVLWILGQIACLVSSFVYFFRFILSLRQLEVLLPDVYLLTRSGIWWGVSMILLQFGVHQVAKEKRKGTKL